MGTKRICVNGLSRSEMDLLEMKIRDIAQAMIKATSQGRTLEIWREDDDTEDGPE